MRPSSLLCALFALGVVVTLQEKKPQKPVIENTTFGFNEGFATFPAQSLKMMSFGYSRVLSNLLWVRFLQNSPTIKVPPGEVSWIYLDFEAISSLDPEFYPVYVSGGIFLSVITEDRKGAELILKKGISIFPNDWRIRANLAYHYQFELNEPQLAYEQYKTAALLPGAPALMGILAAKFMSKTESIETTLDFLRTVLKATAEERMREKLEMKIQEYQKKRYEQSSH